MLTRDNCMNIKKLSVIIILISAVISPIACIKQQSFHAPEALAGVLDLRHFDEASGGIIALDGEWEFYWNELIEPGHFQNATTPKRYIMVPNAWNKQKNTSYPASGYATYRLRILHKKDSVGEIKTLYMPFAHTAYTLWINGKIVGKNGVVGVSKSAMIPFQQPAIVQFLIESPTTEVVLHISNFHQRTGGLLKSIKYGNYGSIARQAEVRNLITIFVASAIFIILLYHFGMYAINRAYIPNLFFGLFSLMVLIRLTLTEEKLFVKYVSFLPWDVYLRLEYIMMSVSIIFFMRYASVLLKNEIPQAVVRICDIYFGFFIVLSLFLEILYLSYFLLFIHVGLFVFSVYVVYVLVRKSRKSMKSAFLNPIGVGVLFITFLNDILYARQIINTVYLTEFGLLAFLFTQSIISLEETVSIQNRLLSINNELEIARRIQQTILPASIPLINKLDIETCYIPMNKVGGDFYSYYQLDANKIGILITDTTGHGIPAALIASSVNLAFNLQRSYAEYPDILIQNMNDVLLGKTGGQFISALYAFVDCERMVAKFSRAGHPQPLILKNDTGRVIELNVSGRIIGGFTSINSGVVACPLNAHDRIILYTDGIIEARNEKGEIFGEGRFIYYLESNSNKNSKELLYGIIDVVMQWAGGRTNIKDDITIIIATVNS